ncbi:nucleotide exchange factor GrpE [Pseudofrankia sp. BMG5.37]|uniref:nucleotide exchange factor GrpE n=1 Tax=Pseudofrankia sp. BMG5.36 TaxID=1834512 RepID=UPI0008DA9EF0|nr:nucleotide exchange factor GrpE [Pseudofrankia sp. BMG5.36]MDT3446529.1 nucleotide exchange factor GrpE [Pseudofrankia sp. BMG5.37]OHV43913.1 nucleotide exchange factor GrpE [Pseudofrankia sp. BMG5.36]
MSSGHDAGRASGRDEEPPVVVRDRRRIDPNSGEIRAQAGTGASAGSSPAAASAAGGAGAPGPDAETLALVESLNAAVRERTADLQRLKAEYDNYRRRVERDRQLIAEQATGRVLGAVLPTLDDIGRARDHGDLEGPFKAVAESLETALEAVGLERFGAVGDEFDPLQHEALMHSYRGDVSSPTCVEVFRAGYSYGGRVLRVAQVAVAEPVDEPEAPAEPAAADTADAPPPDDTGSVPGPGGGGPSVDR